MKNVRENFLRASLKYLGDNKIYYLLGIIFLPIAFSYFRKKFTDLGQNVTIELDHFDNYILKDPEGREKRSEVILLKARVHISKEENYVVFSMRFQHEEVSGTNKDTELNKIISFNHLKRELEKNEDFRNNYEREWESLKGKSLSTISRDMYNFLISNPEFKKYCFLIYMEFFAKKHQYAGDVIDEKNVKAVRNFAKNKIEKLTKDGSRDLKRDLNILNKLHNEAFPQKFLIDYIGSCKGWIINKLGKITKTVNKTVNKSEYGPAIKSAALCGGTLGSLILGIKYWTLRNTGVTR